MRILLVALVMAVASCASRQAAPSPPPAAPAWASPLLVDHPLVGRIHDVTTGRFITRDDARAIVGGAQVVLLGEKHDNADHHRLQADVVAMMVQAGLRPAVAFEMIDVDQQSSVDTYLAHPQRTSRGFGHAVEWEARGWPDYALYEPIISVAMEHGLPIIAANAPSTLVRNLAHQGRAAVSGDLWKQLGLDENLPAEMQGALVKELQDSHCGMLPERALEPMALAQRMRDAQMASRIVEAARPVALIAGAGHTRTDRGVPWHLKRMKPDLRVVSIAFVEVARGETEPRAYLEDGAFDLVWFTLRVDEGDPCEEMRKAQLSPRP